MEILFVALFNMCSKNVDTHYLSDRPNSHLILSQLPRNNDDNNVNNNTSRKNTAQLPVRRSETIILTITIFSLSDSGIRTRGDHPQPSASPGGG